MTTTLQIANQRVVELESDLERLRRNKTGKGTSFGGKVGGKVKSLKHWKALQRKLLKAASPHDAPKPPIARNGSATKEDMTHAISLIEKELGFLKRKITAL